MKRLRDLSLHQLQFISSYIEHRDAPRALRESGYVDGQEMADETIIQKANEFLSDPAVEHEIERRLRVAATASAVTVEEIVDELRKIAFFDMGELYTADGSLKNIHDMDEEARRALLVLDVVQAGENGIITKVKSAPKLQALELLGKHRKMFVDRVEHEHTGSAGLTFAWQLPPGESAEGLLDAAGDDAASKDGANG